MTEAESRVKSNLESDNKPLEIKKFFPEGRDPFKNIQTTHKNDDEDDEDDDDKEQPKSIGGSEEVATDFGTDRKSEYKSEYGTEYMGLGEKIVGDEEGNEEDEVDDRDDRVYGGDGDDEGYDEGRSENYYREPSPRPERSYEYSRPSPPPQGSRNTQDTDAKKAILLDLLNKFRKREGKDGVYYEVKRLSMEDSLEDIQAEVNRIKSVKAARENLNLMVNVYKFSFGGIELLSRLTFGTDKLDGYGKFMAQEFDKNYEDYEEAFIEILKDFSMVLPQSPYSKVLIMFAMSTMTFVMTKHLSTTFADNGSGLGNVMSTVSNILMQPQRQPKPSGKMSGPSDETKDFLNNLSDSDSDVETASSSSVEEIIISQPKRGRKPKKTK